MSQSQILWRHNVKNKLTGGKAGGVQSVYHR